MAIGLKYSEEITAESLESSQSDSVNEFINNFSSDFYRIKEGKIFAGVCTGIADKYKINAWLVRVITVISGIGLIPYIVLAIILKYNDNEIIEQKDSSESAQSTTSHEINKKKIAIIAGAIALAGIVITLVFVLCGKSGDVFVDTRDGQKYKTITFGPWTFMTENIRYNNSYNVCKTDDPTCEKHGRYYFKDGAALACPPGWKMLDGTDAMEKVLVAKLAQKYNMSAFEVFSDMGKLQKVYTKDNDKAAILEFIDSEACIFDGKTNDFTCGKEYCNSEGVCQKKYVGCLNSGRTLQC
ncbi:FISUMP domain-containing protein, partial [uncultured Fibrobacter sp.]|uniref:FISUMP domain-containing protein n=1 Tax=uncultured Fibrobacter sp. TaxID=261512 RepID=UPI00259AE899